MKRDEMEARYHEDERADWVGDLVYIGNGIRVVALMLTR